MRTACLPLAALALLSLAPLTRAQERSAPAPQRATDPAQPAASPARGARDAADRARDPAMSPEGGQTAALPAGRMAATETWRRTLLARRAAARGEQAPEPAELPLHARSARMAGAAGRELPSRAERLTAAAGRASSASESAPPARAQRPGDSDAHRVPAGSQTVGGRGPTTLQHGVPLFPVLVPRAPAAPAADPAGAAAPAADAPAPAPSDAGGSPR